MASTEEDTMVLDLTKKKKKKKPVNLDELIGNQSSSPAPEAQEDAPPKPEGDADDLDFSNVKKKKKKKKAFALDEEDASEKPQVERRPEREILDSAGESGDELMAVTNEENDGELDLSQLKKKKKKDVTFADEMEETQEDIHVNLGESTWAGTDRDYTYDELLARVFDIMRKKNPEMVAGEKKRFIMKPPQCARVGTRKTSFINFTEVCAVLHRQPKHCLSFILAELGTSGSVDGNNQLIIKGRFQQKQLESVLRRYIKEYVTCHTCRSPDTVLERKDRLYFLRCNVCQSRCSVASIKSGFQAVTGKRARMRAKAT